MKIVEALKSVRGETDATVDAMIQILTANNFAADDPADGAFRSLTENLLLGMHFTSRQVAAIMDAQRIATRGGLAKGLKRLIKGINVVMAVAIAGLTFAPSTASTATGLKVCAVITIITTFLLQILEAWQKWR